MEAFHDGTSSMGGYIRRTADQSIFAIMDSSQWAYALFDAGCWGYASVTISTLAPLVFVRRIRRSPVQRFAADIREWGEQKEAAITNVSTLPSQAASLSSCTPACSQQHMGAGKRQYSATCVVARHGASVCQPRFFFDYLTFVCLF